MGGRPCTTSQAKPGFTPGLQRARMLTLGTCIHTHTPTLHTGGDHSCLQRTVLSLGNTVDVRPLRSLQVQELRKPTEGPSRRRQAGPGGGVGRRQGRATRVRGCGKSGGAERQLQKDGRPQKCALESRTERSPRSGTRTPAAACQAVPRAWAAPTCGSAACQGVEGTEAGECR